MFPNTKRNTARLLDRIAILQTTGGGASSTRVVRPYVGVYSSSSKKKSADDGGRLREVDYSETRPTHVVHLLSNDPYAYRDVGGGEVEERAEVAGSPYVREGGRVTSVGFAMRQSLVGLEQMLRGLEGKGVVPKPHFTFVGDIGVSSFVSNVDDDNDDANDGNDGDIKGNSVREEEKHRKFNIATKVMEEALFQTYAKTGNATYVGLRLPTTIYGPWGRSGSVDYDLAEVAVRHWRDPEIRSGGSGPSRLLTLAGRDGGGESGRERDVLFVDGESVLVNRYWMEYCFVLAFINRISRPYLPPHIISV